MRKKYNSLQIIYANIEEINDYKKILEKVDIVYHLAAKIKEEENMEKINVIATKKLFEECIKYNVKKVIFFSSVAVYKNNKIINLKTDKCPVSLYGKTKLEAENIGIEYYKKYNLPLIIVQPCTVYGKTYNGSIGKILKSAQNGFCLKIGNGEYKNTIIHIEDLITIAMDLLKNNKYIGKTIICGTETITINKVNQILKANFKIHQIYIPYIIAKLILRLPINFKFKTTIKQLTRESEYITNYKINKYISFEEFISFGEFYDRKY